MKPFAVLKRLTPCFDHSIKSPYSVAVDILQLRRELYHLPCDWSENNEESRTCGLERNDFIPSEMNLNNTNAVGVLLNISGDSWGALGENESC